MSFLETLRRAIGILERASPISTRALGRELELDASELEDLVTELVQVRRVAERDGNVLTRSKGSRASEPADAPDRPPERRQLTMLFSDLVGATDLSTSMDPEEWRLLLQDYYREASAAISRFGGRTAQYLGDGVLAYFGYPVAHEDDAERAIRAALRILSRLPALNEALLRRGTPGVRIRMGVHTGPVVVSDMGEGVHQQVLAMGETTNLAARLQSEARPDTVVISEQTLRLVQGIFVTLDHGERRLRGFARPIRVFEPQRVLGIRSRLDVLSQTELTPLVGRDRELGRLERCWVDAVDRRGCVALVIGEAGIGKSRLIHAFRQRVADQPHTWLEGACTPYGQDTAFEPVLELHRQTLGFSSEDPAVTRLARLETGLEGAGFDLETALPLIAELHDLRPPDSYPALRLSPEALRQQSLQLLEDWLIRLSNSQPVALLIEDLHWSDPSTLELIDRLLDRVAHEPILLLLCFRPDLDVEWRELQHVTRIDLSPLGPAEIAELVAKVSRDRALSRAVQSEIVRRSDGIPLFAEELARAVRDSQRGPSDGEDATLDIPETLQDSLMAKLDGLGPGKEMVQLAAVLGSELELDLLARIADLAQTEVASRLEGAVRDQILFQSEAASKTRYIFRHALIRDTAYQSMLRSTRQQHHRTAADAIIAGMPVLTAARPELVARHLEGAADVPHAVEWWHRAGLVAESRRASEEGVGHLRRGLALAPEIGGEDARTRQLALLEDLLRVLAGVRGWAHPETRDAVEGALSLCNETDGPLRRAVLLYGLISADLASGAYEKAEEEGFELLRVERSIGDPRLRISGHMHIGISNLYRGQLSAADEHLENGLSLFEPKRHDFSEIALQNPGINCWLWRSWALWFRGFAEQASAHAAEAVELARALNEPFPLTYTLAWATGLASLSRSFALALELGDEALNTARKHGFPLLEAVAGMSHCRARAHVGERDASVTYQDFMGKLSGTGTSTGAGMVLGLLADTQLEVGRNDEALRTADLGIKLVEASGERVYLAELQRLSAEALFKHEPRDRGAIDACLERALDVARSQGSRSLELRTLASTVRCAPPERRAEALSSLGHALDAFTEGFSSFDVVDAQSLLDGNVESEPGTLS